MAERVPVEKYGLAVAFERVVATLACSSRTFWKRIGYSVDPEALSHAPAVFALRAVKAIAAETGQGGVSTVVVVQRIHRLFTDGKLTHEQVVAVSEMFDAVEDAGAPDEEVVIAELAPVIRQRMKKDTIHRAVAAYGGNDTDAWDRVLRDAEAATKVGAMEESEGAALDDNVFALLAERKLMTYLPTGIPELDAFLDGGIQRQRLGVIMADPGGGKSMFLGHVSAEACLNGLSVAYASAELPESEVLARLVSNLVGMETRAVLNGHMPEAQARYAAMRARLGPFHVRYFTPGVATVGDIKGWVADTERISGRPIDLLAVDPIDEFVFAGAGAKDSTYTTQGKVTKEIRNYVKERHIVGWGASHVKAGDARRKVISLNDASDSRWKVKTPDVVVSAMLGENGSEVVFNIAKNRGGKGHMLVGPLPTGFAYGMMVNVSRGGEVPPESEKESAF